MNPDTINAIKEALAPVAEKIGQGAEYAWEIVVRQQAIEGIAYLLSSVFCFFIGINGIYIARRGYLMPRIRKYSWDDGESVSDLAGFLMTMGIVLQLSWVLGMFFLSNGVLHLLSPEFYALDFFIGLTKPAVQ